MTAGEIAAHLDVTKSTLSGHFNVLKAADLVSFEKENTTITYSLNTTVVEDLMTTVFEMFGEKNKPEPVSSERPTGEKNE